MKEHNRVYGLDIYRAIAILLVVFVHGSFLLNNTVLEGFPYIKMIDGVELFFVLSGFLIGGILLKEINRGEVFSVKQLGTFWKRRWFRTLPNYYLILLLNYIVVRNGFIIEDINQFSWKFIFFLQNFSSPFYGFFWESWSLAVEEWFYLLFPIVLIILLKLLSPKKAFLITTILMLLGPLLYRISIVNPAIDNFWYDVTFRKVVLARLDSIAYGLLAAWVFYYYKNVWQKVRIPAFVLGVVGIIFLVYYEAPVTGIYKQVVYFSLVPVAAVAMLPFAESIKTGRGIFAKAITHISIISYSMYLINLALVAEVLRDNFAPTGNADGILKYAIYWIVVVGASTLLYKYFEKPIMNLRNKK